MPFLGWIAKFKRTFNCGIAPNAQKFRCAKTSHGAEERIS